MTRVYYAENRMTSETQGGGLVAGTYTYNADGQRVRRKVNGVETWQVYGMEGELLAEYPANGAVTSPQKEYGYRNGEQLLITAESEMCTNVALSANGATATASSLLNAGFHAAATNNGDRKGTNWGSGGGWADSTSAAFPDWLQKTSTAAKLSMRSMSSQSRPNRLPVL